MPKDLSRFAVHITVLWSWHWKLSGRYGRIYRYIIIYIIYYTFLQGRRWISPLITSVCINSSDILVFISLVALQLGKQTPKLSSREFRKSSPLEYMYYSIYIFPINATLRLLWPLPSPHMHHWTFGCQPTDLTKCPHDSCRAEMHSVLLWASYQIRKIAGCVCAGNAGNVFPATDFKGNR